MACLKCGKKTKDAHVFCPACLTAMEAYPVKPDLHVQLPNRKERELPKRSNRRRRVLSPEEQLFFLKKRQRRLIAAIVLLVILLGAALGLLICYQTAPEALPWSKNQTTVLPTE